MQIPNQELRCAQLMEGGDGTSRWLGLACCRSGVEKSLGVGSAASSILRIPNRAWPWLVIEVER